MARFTCPEINVVGVTRTSWVPLSVDERENLITRLSLHRYIINLFMIIKTNNIDNIESDLSLDFMNFASHLILF